MRSHSSFQDEKTLSISDNPTSCQQAEKISPINWNQTSYQQAQSPLSLDLIAKIQQLEASHYRVCFLFNNQTLSILRQWKTIRIICQDFEIRNDQLFIIRKLTNTIIIHPKISSFGSCCFHSCSKLTSIILPNSITSLDKGYFSYCSKLSSIILPNSMTYLDNYYFSEYLNLISIILPSSISYLDNYCFSECLNLTSIILPNSITFIGECFFINV
jgi:hypothetical protein